MARHKLEVTELNHEQSVGNLRQMVLALAGVPDDGFYIANVRQGRIVGIDVRYDDQGVPVDPQTLPMRAVRMEAKTTESDEGDTEAGREARVGVRAVGDRTGEQADVRERAASDA